MRQVQRDFRRRKEDSVTELRARIKMLEDTVEEMSTTFVGLSDSVLQSHHIRSQPRLITSIGHSVKRALELAVNATREPDEEPEAVYDDQESSQGEPDALLQPGEASAVSAASSQGETSTTVRFVTTNEMSMPNFYTLVGPQLKALPSIEAAVQERQSVPQNVRRMLTQNTFFTKEFWGGDYTTMADMHMVERPNRPLPFWERLLRVNLTTVIHRLTNDGMRGDTNFCVRWGARSFRYSLQHKSKADLLAGTRWVIDTIVAMDARVDSMDRGVFGPKQIQQDWRPHIETYFDNHDLRISGAATMHSMVLAGVPVENLINAHEVERYLKEKGMVEVNENEMDNLLSNSSSH